MIYDIKKSPLTRKTVVPRKGAKQDKTGKNKEEGGGSASKDSGDGKIKKKKTEKKGGKAVRS